MTEMTVGADGSYVNPHSGEALDSPWIHDTEPTDQGADAWAEMRPFPVKVVQTDVEQVAPEATAWSSFGIPVVPAVAGTGALQPLQVCPHRYRRYKAKFLFTATAAAIVYIDKVPDRLMSNALGATFQLSLPVTATSVSPLPDYDGSQPLYMMASVAGVTVNIMDEGYKVVQ